MLIAVCYYTFPRYLGVSGFIVSLSANSSFRTMELFSGVSGAGLYAPALAVSLVALAARLRGGE